MDREIELKGFRVSDIFCDNQTISFKSKWGSVCNSNFPLKSSKIDSTRMSYKLIIQSRTSNFMLFFSLKSPSSSSTYIQAEKIKIQKKRQTIKSIGIMYTLSCTNLIYAQDEYMKKEQKKKPCCCGKALLCWIIILCYWFFCGIFLCHLLQTYNNNSVFSRIEQ